MAVGADINELCEAAKDAVLAGEYATARQKLTAAWVLLAGVPDSRGSQTESRFDRATVKAMLEQLDKLESGAAVSAAGVMRHTRVTYAKPTDG